MIGVLRSHRERVAAAALAVAAAAVVVLLLAGGSRGTAGLRAGTKVPLPERRDAAASRPARRVKRLTEGQAIERVRRVTPWVTKGYTRRKLVALTFDDGPGAVTPALLAELRRLRAPATFFQVGSSVHEHRAVAREEYRRPFAAGSHTDSHARLPEFGPASQRREIQAGATAMDQNGGRYPRMFRPPYGAFDDNTLGALRRRRTLMVLWSVTARDWTSPGTAAIAGKVLREVHPGAIVLMHDAGGATREPTLLALPAIVRGLRRRGYRLVTVPALLRAAPPRRRPPRPPSPYPS